MGERDPAAAMAQKYKPIQSPVPGTTLGPIQIDAFLGGGVWYFCLCIIFVNSTTSFTVLGFLSANCVGCFVTSHIIYDW